MPFKRKYGAKTRRKVGRSSTFAKRKNTRRPRRKAMARPSRSIIRQPSGTADSLYVKLRYTQTDSFTTTGGISVYNVYHGNSIYDPNYTGGGTQPYFFDQWATLYGKYTVVGSSIRSRMFNNGAVAMPLEVTVVPSTDGTGYGSQLLISEQPYATNKQGQVSTVAPIIKKYMSTAKILGIHRSQVYDDPACSAAVTTDPATPWFWHVFASPMDNSTTMTILVRTTLTYYVRFFRRTRPGVS